MADPTPPPAPAAAPAAPAAPQQPLIANDQDASTLVNMISQGQVPPDLKEPMMQALQHYQLNRQGGEPTTAANVAKAVGSGLLNAGADVAGAPVDLVSAGVRALGGHEAAAPYGGSQWIKGALESDVPGSTQPDGTRDNPLLAGIAGTVEGAAPVVPGVGDVPTLLSAARRFAGSVPAAGATIKALLDAGYKLRPSDVAAAGAGAPAPPLLARAAESMGGPTGLKRDITASNQAVTTAQGQKLAPGSEGAVMPADIQRAAQGPAKVYQQTAGQLGQIVPTNDFASRVQDLLAAHNPDVTPGAKPYSAKALAAIRSIFPAGPGAATDQTAQLAGKGYLTALQTLRDEGAYDAAGAVEDELQRHLPPDQLNDFKAARTQFAQLYDLADSTNPTTGQVSAAKIAQQPSAKPNGLRAPVASGPIGLIAAARQAAPAVTGLPAAATGGGLGVNLHTMLPAAALTGAGTGMHYLGMSVPEITTALAAVPAIKALARQYVLRRYPGVLARQAAGVAPGATAASLAQALRAGAGGRVVTLPAVAAQEASEAPSGGGQ